MFATSLIISTSGRLFTFSFLFWRMEVYRFNGEGKQEDVFCRVEDQTKAGISEKIKRTLPCTLSHIKAWERVYSDISTKKYTRSFWKPLYSATGLNLMQRERGKDKDFSKPRIFISLNNVSRLWGVRWAPGMPKSRLSNSCFQFSY